MKTVHIQWLIFMVAGYLASEPLNGQAATIVSPPVTIVSLEDMVREREPELFRPRGEFESSDEYEQRLARQKRALETLALKLMKEAEARQAEWERLEAERAAALERDLQLKIAASRTAVTYTPTAIGTYDADREIFPLTVAGMTLKLKVPRSEARTFKENYRAARAEGYQQLTRDLKTYEIFNLVVTHPVTGSRYPCGPQKELEELPVTATGRQAVVPPDLAMRVAFVEPNGNGYLDAEEEGRVKVAITNNGKGSALGVLVNMQAENRNEGVNLRESSRLMGEIPPGQTRTAEFLLHAAKTVARQVNRFTVSATESYGFPPDPVQISFETLPFIPPRLELVDFGISTATGDNVIRPGVVTTVQARVQNRGQGEAEKSRFTINLPQGVYFTPDSRREWSFAVLKPGEFKDLEFSFTPSKTVKTTIEITLGFVEESTNGLFPLRLAVEKPQRTIEQLVVKGKELSMTEIGDVATVSVDIEKDIPRSRRSGKTDLAVVFGIETYKNVPSVTFARRDAQWVKKYFEEVLGIPVNRIYYLTDADVSQAEFNKVFGKNGWLDKRKVAGQTEIFVYYAGHGAPDVQENKAYLIPYDGDPNYASQTGYELDALYAALGGLGVRSVTVFLDACFSGANRNNEMLLADARPVFMEVSPALTGNVTVFSASGGKEISSAWPEKKHGLFSYFLMKGMRGEADIDGDKQVTVGELGDYLRANVSQTAGMLDREQTPGLATLDRERVIIRY